MNIEVRRYAAELADVWNALVASSRNGLFLFDRRYMDYHRDRFHDFSALAYVDARAVLACPASWSPESGMVTSHGGLTFGGFVTRTEMRGEAALACIDAVLDAMRDWGGRELEVRLIPQFLARYPAAEGDYALWRRGFSLVRRDLSSAIPLRHRMALNASKTHATAKAIKAGLTVGAGLLAQFHPLLAEVLGAHHSAAPVHSLAELELLASRFPEQVFLRSAERDGEMLAGALIYRYPTAWHTQYMAASVNGRATGALDLVISRVIEEAAQSGADWLSFGTSTTDRGRSLNEGLLWQKESFGARSVTHDFMRGVL